MERMMFLEAEMNTGGGGSAKKEKFEDEEDEKENEEGEEYNVKLLMGDRG